MPRIQITISSENLDLLEQIYRTCGVNKSAQINSLIAKFLEKEYCKVEKGEKSDEK